MALVFATGTTDNVNVGSAASLDNLAAGSILSWVYPATVLTSNRRIADKVGTQLVSFAIGDSNNGDFVLRYSRTTTGLVIRTNGSLLTENVWRFLAGTWDAALTNTDQHLYHGTLTALAVEPSYAQQQVGSGTHDDASANMIIGNRSGLSTPLVGRIAWVGIWNRQLSLGECKDQQFHPHVTSGCVGFWHLGFAGTGTQPDWSGSGNAGTVTGATVEAHVPLGPAFGFDSINAYRVVVGGRTTKNTDLRPLGFEAGMSRRFAA